MIRLRILVALLLVAITLLPVAGAQVPEERIEGRVVEATVIKYPDNSSQLLLKLELDPELDGMFEYFVALTNASARIYSNIDFAPVGDIDSIENFEAELEGEEGGVVKGWIRSSVEDENGKATLELNKLYYKYYRENATAYVEVEGKIEATGEYADLLAIAGNLSNLTGVRVIEAEVTRAPGTVEFKYKLYVTTSLDMGLVALAYSRLIEPITIFLGLPEGLTTEKASISLEFTQSRVRGEIDVRLKGNMSSLLKVDSIGVIMGLPLLAFAIENVAEVCPAVSNIMNGLRAAALRGELEVVLPTYYGVRLDGGSGEVVLPRIVYTRNPAGTPQALADTARENIRALNCGEDNVAIVEGQLDEPPVQLPEPVKDEYMGEVSATGHLLSLLALTVIVLAVAGILVWLGRRM